MLRFEFMLFSLLSCQILCGQDTLLLEDIKSYTYEFQIKNGQIEGKGAEFLINEFAKTQIVMLGEYHGQKSISEFTGSIIPVLNKNGFKHMALEVGPTMGDFLNSLNAPNVEKDLKKINQQYHTKDGEDIYTPIPFFDTVEDAKFLDEAKKHEWNVFGVDQEYYDSFPFLFDLMFGNLTENQKAHHKKLHQSAIDSLQSFYQREVEKGESYVTLISESQVISEFLKTMHQADENAPLVEAFTKSVEIYKLNDDSRWYENYQTRIAYMKQLLRTEFEKEKFNVVNDKLLIKMGRLHLSKGTSPYAFNELGNTLTELCEYNGVTALGIGFETRFHIENDVIMDELDSDSKYMQNYREFKKFGDKYKWTILDLRPMRKDFHWHPQPLKGKLNAYLQELIVNYDILIIPPAYDKSTPNY